MRAAIHGQATSTTAETVTFWSVFTAMAVLAEQFLIVLCAVGGIQSFIAQSYSDN